MEYEAENGESVRLLVAGTNDYASVLIDAFEGQGPWIFEGLLENLDRERCKLRPMGLPVYWSEDSTEFAATHHIVCSLNTTLRKAWIEDLSESGFLFQTLIHPSAVVSARASVATGSIVEPASVVAGFTTIGHHVKIGRGVTVGHHSQIAPYTTIHPGARISGNSKIGEQVTIGTGAVVLDHIEIGDGAFIGAGTTVTKNVDPAVLYAASRDDVVIRPNYGPK